MSWKRTRVYRSPLDAEEIEALVAELRPLGPVPRPLWLYAIQAGHSGPVKLGSTNWPAKRLVTLQIGSADKLRGLAAWRGSLDQEEALHRLFSPLHVHGEWFRPFDVLLEFVLREGGDFCDWELEAR